MDPSQRAGTALSGRFDAVLGRLDAVLTMRFPGSFQRAWADPTSGMVFCLSEAPSADAVQRIHARAGHLADAVYEVSVTV
jgi:hypothetical protein